MGLIFASRPREEAYFSGPGHVYRIHSSRAGHVMNLILVGRNIDGFYTLNLIFTALVVQCDGNIIRHLFFFYNVQLFFTPCFEVKFVPISYPCVPHMLHVYSSNIGEASSFTQKCHRISNPITRQYVDDPLIIYRNHKAMFLIF